MIARPDLGEDFERFSVTPSLREIPLRFGRLRIQNGQRYDRQANLVPSVAQKKDATLRCSRLPVQAAGRPASMREL